MSTPLPEGQPEEKLSQNNGMISFSRLTRSIWSLLEEETCSINHSYPFIEWQMQQLSTTVVYPDKDVPKLHILPS